MTSTGIMTLPPPPEIGAQHDSVPLPPPLNYSISVIVHYFNYVSNNDNEYCTQIRQNRNMVWLRFVLNVEKSSAH